MGPPKDSDVFQDSFNAFTESVEQQFELAAKSLQDLFRDSPWLPEQVRPKTPPPPRFKPDTKIPLGYLASARSWVSEHRAVTAAVVAFVGTGAFIIWHRRRADKAKRRAKRSKRGAKTEVVIVAGSPLSPITRSLALDLERRGFIVYVPVGTAAEEHAIQSEAREDIKALSVDVTSPQSLDAVVQDLFRVLHGTSSKHSTSQHQGTLNLAALIVTPSSTFPTVAIANTSAMDWSDTFNNHLIAPFALLHTFLPLLSQQSSNILFLTPSITPSLSSPSHAPESVVFGALEKYISTLRREHSANNIVQLKLGLFDYSKFSEERKQLVLADRERQAVDPILDPKQEARIGSPLRELHNVVFDVIERGKARNGTIFVGRGSTSYALVGNWMPQNFVNWLVNMTKSEKPIFRRLSNSNSSMEASSEWEAVH